MVPTSNKNVIKDEVHGVIRRSVKMDGIEHKGCSGYQHISYRGKEKRA